VAASSCLHDNRDCVTNCVTDVIEKHCNCRPFWLFTSRGQYENLSCRREAARCFVSLNISLHHSKPKLVLFWCRRSIATGSSVLTPYLNLLDVGKLRPLRERKKCHSRSFKVIGNGNIRQIARIRVPIRLPL